MFEMWHSLSINLRTCKGCAVWNVLPVCDAADGVLQVWRHYAASTLQLSDLFGDLSQGGRAADFLYDSPELLNDGVRAQESDDADEKGFMVVTAPPTPRGERRGDQRPARPEMVAAWRAFLPDDERVRSRAGSRVLVLDVNSDANRLCAAGDWRSIRLFDLLAERHVCQLATDVDCGVTCLAHELQRPEQIFAGTITIRNSSLLDFTGRTVLFIQLNSLQRVALSFHSNFVINRVC